MGLLSVWGVKYFKHDGDKILINILRMNWWVDKQNVHIYSVEYYLAIEKNEVLTTLMNPANIMLNERS